MSTLVSWHPQTLQLSWYMILSFNSKSITSSFLIPRTPFPASSQVQPLENRRTFTKLSFFLQDNQFVLLQQNVPGLARVYGNLKNEMRISWIYYFTFREAFNLNCCDFQTGQLNMWHLASLSISLSNQLDERQRYKSSLQLSTLKTAFFLFWSKSGGYLGMGAFQRE